MPLYNSLNIFGLTVCSGSLILHIKHYILLFPECLLVSYLQYSDYLH